MFINLYGYSDNSFFKGLSKPEILAETSMEINDGVIAITDINNIFGSIHLQKKMKALNGKGIVGVELMIEDKDYFKNENSILLYVKNETGYKNLCNLLSLVDRNKLGNLGYAEIEMLTENSEGLIAIVIDTKVDISALQKIFKDDLYIDINLENKYSLKQVPLKKYLYAKKEDAFNSKLLNAMGEGKSINLNIDIIKEGSDYLISNDEAIKIFPLADFSVFDEINEKCKFEFDFGHNKMPGLKLPDKFKDENEFFVFKVREGYKRRFQGTDKFKDQRYIDRIKYEMDTIISMGFSGYFLIVQDFIEWAKENDILIGPGRGSAAGSLVSYSLGIIDLDPIDLDLLFERFLNPERVTMPDIDVDIPKKKRGLVIDYLREKYGNVSKIITFGTMAVKSAIRDVARVCNIDLSLVDKITKTIGDKPNIKFSEVFENEEFLKIYHSNDKIKQVLNSAKELYGTRKQVGKHASGILICNEKVESYLPNFYIEESNKNDDGSTVYSDTAAFDMAECEELGLLKMDLLGLRTLDVIDDTIKSIKKIMGKTVIFSEIDIYDKEIYKYIQSKDTTGIFQIESSGMQKLMSEIFVDVNDVSGRECFERLIAAISLYRPGPMDYIGDYIEGMRNPKNIHYDHEMTREILEKTYGVLVYQEQVQQLVRKLAGYSLGRADLVRRGMAKKKASIIEAEEKNFIYGNEEEGIKGCISNGIDEKTAKIIWDKMAKFAEYAFNKSHAAAYAKLSAITGYLKAHFETIYMTETLNSFLNQTDKLKVNLAKTRELGIKILPPNINQSTENFKVVGKKEILFGLKALKNINKTAPMLTCNSYKDLSDFLIKTEDFMDKSTLTSLIFSGALDEFGFDKMVLEYNVERMIAWKKKNKAKKERKKQDSQLSLFDVGVLDSEILSFEVLDDFGPGVTNSKSNHFYKLVKEFETCGMFISRHPASIYKEIARSLSASNIGNIIDSLDSKKVLILGILTDIKYKNTKNKERMAKGVISDETGELPFVVFPGKIEEVEKFSKNEIVLMDARVDYSEDFGLQLIVNEIISKEKASDMAKNKKKKITVRINKEDIWEFEKFLKENIEVGDVKLIVQIGKKKVVAKRGIKGDLKNINKIKNKYQIL